MPHREGHSVNGPFMELSGSTRSWTRQARAGSLAGMRTPFLAAAGALLALASPAGPHHAARADDEGDRARAAARDGRVVGLAPILDWIEARYHGRLLEAELEEDDDEPPVYEIEWLTPSGDVLEFEFDARTGAMLEVEGRGIEAARKP